MFDGLIKKKKRDFRITILDCSSVEGNYGEPINQTVGEWRGLPTLPSRLIIKVYHYRTGVEEFMPGSVLTWNTSNPIEKGDTITLDRATVARP